MKSFRRRIGWFILPPLVWIPAASWFACAPRLGTIDLEPALEFPRTVAARWAMAGQKRRHRARWEACWTNPYTMFAVWYGPLGQTLAAVWMDARRVIWKNRPGKEIWTWTNDPEGWSAVVGLPLHGRDLLPWLAGRWPPASSAEPAVQEMVHGLSVLRREGRIGDFQYTAWRFSDRRMWRQEWASPWRARVRLEYRYRGTETWPIQLLWVWSAPDHETEPITMRWDGFEWASGECRIPPEPSLEGSAYPVYHARDVFEGSQPMIVTLFGGGR